MKLYVGNFIYTTTEKDLKELFSSHGSVENVRIIYDQFTRQSKCFGYVDMQTMQDGEKAIDALDGKSFNDQPIIVKKARKL